MPNQFFSRGYNGYPYPQQNMFPYASEGYQPYPYMNGGMPQMPQQPYMQNMVYMDPHPYMPRQQYDYPYQQMGYAAPSPYEMQQMVQPPMGAGMPGAYSAPQAMPAPYPQPYMQAPSYGVNYGQQAYMPAYQPVVSYAPQYMPYLDPAQQYWQDYQAMQGAGAPYSPEGQDRRNDSRGRDRRVKRSQQHDYEDGTSGSEFGGAKAAPRKQPSNRQSAQGAGKRSRYADDRQAQSQRKQAARRQQEEARQQTVKRDPRRHAETSQEAANRQAAVQDAARQNAIRQTSNDNAISQQIGETVNHMKEDPNNQQQNVNTDPAAAAAAASIAAFHQAARSVNEINLNEVTKALQTKPESSLELEDLGFDFITKPSQTTDNAEGSASSPETGSITIDSAATKASDIEIPGISLGAKGAEQPTEAIDATKAADVAFPMPNAEDAVVIDDKSDAENAKAAPDEVPTAEATTKFVAVKDEDGEEAVTEVKVEEASTESANGDEATEALVIENAEKKPESAEGENTISAKTAADVATEQAAASAKPPMTPVAIVTLVFGIIGVLLAAATPFLNILGYGALAVGVITLVLSAIAIFQTKGNKKSGRPMTIVGIICGLIAIIVAIVLHLVMPASNNASTSSSTPNANVLNYSTNNSSSSASANSADGNTSTDQSDVATTSPDSGNDATQGSDTGSNSATISGQLGGVGTTTTSSSAASALDITPSGAHEDLAVGTSVQYSNGLTITVDSIENGLKSTSGKDIVCVTVTYKNDGSTPLDYNSFDWKVEDANGTMRTYAIFPSGENELNSGELSSGASVTGNLYFEGPFIKVIYEANYWNSASNTSWKA